jgi:hypothetical protein
VLTKRLSRDKFVIFFDEIGVKVNELVSKGDTIDCNHQC